MEKEIISEKLSTIHNVNENKEYWRIVVYLWLAAYVTYIFDRWENIRIFFEMRFFVSSSIDDIKRSCTSIITKTQSSA